MNLQENNLIVISPHFQKFQQSQTIASRQYFANVNVLVPQPLFPSILLRLPPIERRLLFLRNAKGFCGNFDSIHGVIPVYCPKYPAIPIPWIRTQMPRWTAKSCLDIITRKKIEFDIVHCHRLDYAYTGVVLKRSHNSPLIVTCHGSDVYEYPHVNHFNYRITQTVLHSVDRAIAVGTSDAKGLVSLGFPSSKITIIPNGFDEQIFQPIAQDTAKKKLGFHTDDQIILSVGSLLPIKGHIHLLRAVKKLSRMRTDFRLVIVGSGPLETKLLQEAKELGIRSLVNFVGAKPLETISSWISASQFVVIPSLNEGFPTVIPEAFSCGKPVVGTYVGSIPDALSDDEVGIMVQPANPMELSNALNLALNKNWNSEAIMKKSQEYTLEKISERLKTLYAQVLS